MSSMSLNPMLEEARRRRALEEESTRQAAFKVGDNVEYSHPNGHGHTYGKIKAIRRGAAHIASINGPRHVVAMSKVHGKTGDWVNKRIGEAAGESATSKTPASVHTGDVFDDKNPADSYPAGTEINFGETAPVDMGGIPDLFDPAAVTGDGI